MDFLSDYLTYHRCYKPPDKYVLMSAIGLIGAVMHRKIYFLIGDTEVHANNYIILIGPMGNGKTTCRDFAEQVFRFAVPGLAVGRSNQTAEDIVKWMADNDPKTSIERVFTNERGEEEPVKPVAFFINEFKNFISYNPTRMIDFLVDIYDRKFYDSGTIKRGAEIIINPSINILACANPDPLVKLMKNDTVSGGMGRRMIIVNLIEHGRENPRPLITPDAEAAWIRVKDRVKAASKIVGQFKDTPDGNAFFDDWFHKNFERMKKETNQLVAGYLNTKDVHLKKTAMAIDVVSDKPMLQFTAPLLEEALALLDSIEEHMHRLTIAAGRNELIGPQMKILEILQQNGGMLSEKQLIRRIESELNDMEQWRVLRGLENTDRIVRQEIEVPNSEGNPVKRLMVFLPETFEEVKKNGKFKRKE